MYLPIVALVVRARPATRSQLARMSLGNTFGPTALLLFMVAKRRRAS